MYKRQKSSSSHSRKSTKFALPVLIAVVTIALVGLSAKALREVGGQPTPAAIDIHVRRSLLQPRLRDALKVMGDRLEKPGKERLTLLGTLKRAISSSKEPASIRLIAESPGKLRLEEQSGSQTRVIIFNGQRVIATGQPSEEDLELVEWLAFDTPDHFFFSQTRGAATRFLGSRFRLDDGQTVDYKGPFYDIYQVSDRIPLSEPSRAQQKAWYFNSDTARLEQVHYQTTRGGSLQSVIVRFSDWRSFNGQQIPGIFSRYENGEEKLTLTVTSIGIGPRVEDSIFTTP